MSSKFFKRSLFLSFMGVLLCGQVIHAGFLNNIIGYFFPSKQFFHEEQKNTEYERKPFLKELSNIDIKSILQGQKYIQHIYDDNLDLIPQKNIEDFSKSLNSIYNALHYHASKNKQEYEANDYTIDFTGTNLGVLVLIAEKLYIKQSDNVNFYSGNHKISKACNSKLGNKFHIDDNDACCLEISSIKINKDDYLFFLENDETNSKEELYGSLNKIDFEKTYGDHGNMCKLGKYTDFDLKFDYKCLK